MQNSATLWCFLHSGYFRAALYLLFRATAFQNQAYGVALGKKLQQRDSLSRPSKLFEANK